MLEKVAEEIAEVKQAADPGALENEIGDLLFAVVNFCRWKGVDAESALRASSRKFYVRFGFIERDTREHGRKLSDLTFAEMDTLWTQAKSAENQGTRPNLAPWDRSGGPSQAQL